MCGAAAGRRPRTTRRVAALLMNSASPPLSRLRSQTHITLFDTGVGRELLPRNEAGILASMAHAAEFVTYSLGAAAVTTAD